MIASILPAILPTVGKLVALGFGSEAKYKISIDQVIPWSYLYSDDLWNLVYVETSLNSSKQNRIPNEETINKLEHRNKRLLKILVNAAVNDKHTEELRLSAEKDYVKKFWVGCKG